MAHTPCLASNIDVNLIGSSSPSRSSKESEEVDFFELIALAAKVEKTDTAVGKAWVSMAANFKDLALKNAEVAQRFGDLQAVVKSVGNGLQCEIGLAMGIMGTAVTFNECDHTFDAKCIRDIFRITLKQRLREIRIPDEVFSFPWPTNDEEQTEVFNEIVCGGEDPYTIFSYRCPLCLATIQRMPSSAIGTSNVFLDIQAAKGAFHDANGDCGVDDEGVVRVAGDNFFSGLFLEPESED
ncbi:hypothetical protein Hypma_003365 [Hypsizygus marmoreus]|uniref:Uncharacterized protein n=1 Tax=Hypsizygus marmoreus TaxID=39966 RepID=A0A369J2B6_HYPMA|nr:hypothetical protein Hypma_003365 [Hypsizygus marmoreus]